MGLAAAGLCFATSFRRENTYFLFGSKIFKLRSLFVLNKVAEMENILFPCSLIH